MANEPVVNPFILASRRSDSFALARSIDAVDEVISAPPPVNQLVWYIDPITGNDNSSGENPASALKTWAGFMLRIDNREIQGNAVAHILTDLPVNDPMTGRIKIGAAGSLLIIGEPTVVYSGTVTAATNQNPGANVNGSIEDSTLPSGWAPHVGKRIHTPHNGQYAWVAKDLGANVAHVTCWSALSGPDGAPYPWTPAELAQDTSVAYDVEELTFVAGGCNLRVELSPELPYVDEGKLVFCNLRFTTAAITISGTSRGITTTIALNLGTFRHVMFSGCEAESFVAEGGAGMSAHNCKQSALTILSGRSVITFRGGLIATKCGAAGKGAVLAFERNCVVMEAVVVEFGATLFLGVCSLNDATADAIVMARAGKVHLSGFSDQDPHCVYGSGGALFKFILWVGSSLHTNGSGVLPPPLTSGGPDLHVGTADKTWAELPYFDTATMGFAGPEG